MVDDDKRPDLAHRDRQRITAGMIGLILLAAFAPGTGTVGDHGVRTPHTALVRGQ